MPRRGTDSVDVAASHPYKPRSRSLQLAFSTVWPIPSPPRRPHARSRAAKSLISRGARAFVPQCEKSRRRSLPAIVLARSPPWPRPSRRLSVRRKKASSTAMPRAVKSPASLIASRDSEKNSCTWRGALWDFHGARANCGLPSICCRIVTSILKICKRNNSRRLARVPRRGFCLLARTDGRLP